jgi:DNA ligase-1
MERKLLWEKPPIGRVVKYKHFPYGADEKPRHPVFLGFRPEEDMLSATSSIPLNNF